MELEHTPRFSPNGHRLEHLGGQRIPLTPQIGGQSTDDPLGAPQLEPLLLNPSGPVHKHTNEEEIQKGMSFGVKLTEI